MIFNKIITDIYLMGNPRISVRYHSNDTLDLRVDDVLMGTITYSDNSVFYKDIITLGNRDIERREYFLSKIIHNRILRLKDPNAYGGYMVNIYKITGIRK